MIENKIMYLQSQDGRDHKVHTWLGKTDSNLENLERKICVGT